MKNAIGNASAMSSTVTTAATDRAAGRLVGYSDFSMVIFFAYLGLPYMILPIFAGLERIPGSLLEASADLVRQR